MQIENAVMNNLIVYDKSGEKIDIRCKYRNKAVPRFIGGVSVLAILGILYLDIDWIKLASRIPDMGIVFYKLIHFEFSQIDLIAISMADTISITVLSTFYSIILGLFFGALGASNITNKPRFSRFVKSFFTFLREVPTPVWVLLMLVCLGMGPEAGIAGLCVHTTAFFTKAFSESFENISDDTINALEATGCCKLAVFTNAVLPSAMSQIISWTGMRFEINFSECAILGMVGAGGIGFVISSSIQGYDYGTAGLAIFIVFIFAFVIERVFVRIKEHIR